MSKPLSILLGLLFIISGSSGCLESLDNSSNTEPESITSLEDVYSHVLQCENTIIENGTGADFDTNFREIGNIVIDEGNSSSMFKSYYSVYSENASKSNQTFIALAYSMDSISWEKHPIPVISRSLEDPYVIKHEGVFHLFAEDKLDLPFRNIRKYHSFDGINWNDDGDILDVEVGGTPSGWESQDVSSPVVWIESDLWHMLYEGRGNGGGKIGHATSNDGVNWTRNPSNPIFGNGTFDSWDDLEVVPDDLIVVNGTYYFIYHGYSNLTKPHWKVGIAKSEDLDAWARVYDEPLADVNTLMVIEHNDKYLFYFTGDKKDNSPTSHVGGICTFMIDEFEQPTN
jgi:hypothetical protein